LAKVMEGFTIFGYNKGHETQWNPATSGEAAPTRHPIAGKGQREFVGHRPLARSLQKLCLPVDGSAERILPIDTKPSAVKYITPKN